MITINDNLHTKCIHLQSMWRDCLLLNTDSWFWGMLQQTKGWAKPEQGLLAGQVCLVKPRLGPAHLWLGRIVDLHLKWCSLIPIFHKISSGSWTGSVQDSWNLVAI